MGKPKKGKKGQDDDFADNDVEIDAPANDLTEEMDAGLSNKGAKKGKKGKKGRKDEDLDDIEREIAAMSLEANGGKVEEEMEEQPVPKKKEKKKKKKQQGDDEEEEEVTQSKSVFQMLQTGDDDDDDDDDDKGSDDEEEQSKNLKNVNGNEAQNKSKKDKKKSKKGKAKTAEEEDVDAILAALDEPKEKKKGKKNKKEAAVEEAMEEEKPKEDVQSVEVEKQAPRVVTIDDYESDEDTKKKKKKKNKEKEEKAEEEGEGEENEEGGTVKTAAQKKKEKKERERLKKQQKGQQQQKKETDGAAATASAGKDAGATGVVAEVKDKEESSREATPTVPEAGEEGEGDGEGDKDGKKKKKKKGEKEEKKPKNAAMLAKIREQQAKIREEEEARKREEEEAERREEERIRKIEEEKRLEEERRLKKKMKKKEREERLKKEGKFLTEKQKQDRMRLNQMLDVIKEQGGSVPNKDAAPKKRPFYGKKKKDGQHKGDEAEKSPSPEDERAEELTAEEAGASAMETEKGTGNLEVEVEEAEEEVKNAWDEESDDEKEPEQEVGDQAEEEEEEGSEDEEETTEDSEGVSSDDERTPAERGRDKILKRQAEAEERRTTDVLRAPVVCVMGHVDHGKTKILDKLRRTNVQDGEAGGITQQIGATNVPKDAIVEKTKMCKEFAKKPLKLPGMLFIDTPGHESFSNLRSRGSGLCDIAILVVDIMQGLQNQTKESIDMLKKRKTPFVVALNKIDRLYGWKSYPQNDVINTIKAQQTHCKSEFDERTNHIILQLAEEGLNAKLFYENQNPKEYVSMVPTSAHSGDGMGNLVALICELTQTMLAKRLAFSDEFEATVMEVKALQGMGTTIDAIVLNGKLQEGQTMVLAGGEGPIITPVRGLLLPQPMKELRIRTNSYQHQKEVVAAQGVKILAKDLEKAYAGLPLYIAHDRDEIEFYKQEATRILVEALQSIKLSDRGVFVQASTLGSLEALLRYLDKESVKYAGINIGPVHRKDIMKASIMLEHDPQFAVILAFDVEVKRDVQEFAESLGVTIFTADIIYHLFDKFVQYREDLLKKKQEELRHIAVFPCKIKMMPQFIFNSRDPIVAGVVIQEGFLKEGTPVCVPNKEFLDIGRVASIEFNHKPVEIARQGQEVCIKIMPVPGEAPKMVGRHFEADDLIVSKISRESIDAVKQGFRKEMSKADWILIMELKKLFQIL